MSSRGANRADELPSSEGLLARLAYSRLKAASIAPEPLLKKAGLNTSQIENPRVRLKVKDQIRFVNVVADALEDEFLGFHLAQSLELREVGLLYYVMASSDTLPEALQRAARYSSIVNDGISQKCLSGLMIGMLLHFVGVSRHLDRHQTEFWMTAIVRICRQLTGVRLVPGRLRLMHSREHCCAEFQDIFGDDIQFGASADEVAFGTSARHLPVISADPYLNKLLVNYCEEALSYRSPGHSFRSTVENAIVPLLPHGKARAELIAQQLGMSRRTFARRLASEGPTLSELLKDLRLDLAIRYLADDALSVSQIAWLLGYREVAAFSHAFKRWTGKMPREVRSCKDVPLDSSPT
jgi:AraC-like DNA-binding protein